MMPRHFLTLCGIGLIAVLTTVADSRAADPVSRAYINQSCIIADEPFLVPESASNERFAAFLSYVASKLTGTMLNSVIEGIAGGISKQGERRDTHYVTARNVYLFVADLADSPTAILNPEFGCATIVTAELQPPDHDCTSEYIPREVSAETMRLPQSEWKSIRTDNSVENILKRANVCVTGEVVSVLEARVALSADETAYRLENAGYTINSFLSTNSRSAERSVFYTMEVVEPGASADGRVLSLSLVDLGRIEPGASSSGEGSMSSNWLAVPSLSTSARQRFQNDTAAQREVADEIAALDRAATRDRRQLDGMRERAEGVSPAIRESLETEMEKLEVRLIKVESLLAALQYELADMPVTVAEGYMPITVRFGITETRSERRALQAIGSLLEKNSESIANSAADMMGVERSLDGLSGTSDIDAARVAYFDAKVAAELGEPEEAGLLSANLEVAKLEYNAALVAEGLAPVE